jgi:hypothetical protein
VRPRGGRDNCRTPSPNGRRRDARLRWRAPPLRDRGETFGHQAGRCRQLLELGCDVLARDDPEASGRPREVHGGMHINSVMTWRRTTSWEVTTRPRSVGSSPRVAVSR